MYKIKFEFDFFKFNFQRQHSTLQSYVLKLLNLSANRASLLTWRSGLLGEAFILSQPTLIVSLEVMAPSFSAKALRAPGCRIALCIHFDGIKILVVYIYIGENGKILSDFVRGQL